MRIALVISHLDIKGGAQRQFIELGNQLIKNGHEVEIFAAFYNPKQTFSLKKFNKIFNSGGTHQLKKISPQDSFFNTLRKFIFNYFTNQKRFSDLATIINQRNEVEKFDVVNFHDIQIEQIAPSIRNKCVWMMNDLPLFFDLKERKSTKYANSPILPIIIFFEKLRYKKIINSLSKIIVLDKRNHSLVKKYFKLNAEIVKSGLSIKPEIEKNKFKNKKNRLLTTNIFFPHRRYEDVIKALNILVNKKNIKNFEYHIIGKTDTDKKYYNSIVKLIKDYNLEKYIKILGSVSEKKLKEEYKNANIYIFPNHNQTWGLSVFEAMATGCACIVSNTAGAHEVLTNDKNALIFEAKNIDQLEIKIEKLIENKILKEKIALNGLIFVKNHISWRKYTKQMVNIFKKI